jgi:hypothetical protein
MYVAKSNRYDGYSIQQIAPAIQKLRRFQGYDLRAFASKNELSERALRMIEAGNDCRVTTAVCIAAKLGFNSIEAMLKTADEMPLYDTKLLSNTVRILRIALGLSQRDIYSPNSLYRTSTAMSRFESFGTSLSEEKIAKIPEKLGYLDGYRSWPKMIEDAKFIEQNMHLLTIVEAPQKHDAILPSPYDSHAAKQPCSSGWVEGYLASRASGLGR